MRKVKCPICNKMNNKEEAEQIGNRYYCIACAEKRRKEKEKNNEDWVELFEYICKLYDIDKPTGQMFAQLKRFRNEPYNYNNKAMLLTLKYYYEILGNEVKDDTGIGIIEYEYENAKRFYLERKHIKDYLKSFDWKDETKLIKINPSLKLTSKEKQLSFNNIKREEYNEESFEFD